MLGRHVRFEDSSGNLPFTSNLPLNQPLNPPLNLTKDDTTTSSTATTLTTSPPNADANDSDSDSDSDTDFGFLTTLDKNNEVKGDFKEEKGEYPPKVLRLEDLEKEEYLALKRTLTSGIEFYEWYKKLCAKKHVEPLPQLLEQIKDATSHLERVKCIDLMGTDFEIKTAEIFGEIVINDTSLVQVNLECTNLNDELLRVILDRLLFHNKIQWLNIAHNGLLTPECFLDITSFLDRSHLNYLDLSGIIIDKKSAECLAASLMRPESSLAVLRLNECGLITRPLPLINEFRILAKGIQKSRLYEVTLRHNQLDFTAGKEIAAIIAKSQIQRLDLRNNELGSGVIDISKAMAKSETLCEFLLWDNQIDKKIFHKLLKRMKKNRHLKWLGLSENPIFPAPEKTLKLLEDSLINHPSLIVLGLGATWIDNAAMKAISSILKGNHHLLRLDVIYNNQVDFADYQLLSDAVCTDSTLISIEIDDDPTNPPLHELCLKMKSHCLSNRKEFIQNVQAANRLILSSNNNHNSPLPSSNQLGRSSFEKEREGVRERTIPEEVFRSEDTVLGREIAPKIKPNPTEIKEEVPTVVINFDESEKFVRSLQEKEELESLNEEMKKLIPKAKDEIASLNQLMQFIKNFKSL